MSPANRDALRRVQVLDKVVNADLTAPRNEYLFRTPLLVTALTPLLKDERDVPMLCLTLNIMQIVLPGMALVYYVNLTDHALPLFVRHLVGVAYVLMLLLGFQERFTLMLHFCSHRGAFHNNLLNKAFVWLFAPCFGIPCGVYKLHHVIMHHIENNHDFDTSSTEGYQRDSWLQFLRYWFHFAVLIWVELPLYTIRSKRYSWGATMIFGLFVWISALTLFALYVNFVATVWVFIIPHVLAMSLMAFGNWSQHIFVNPQDPTSNYSLTYNCIDTKTNQTTFNDGYHVVHHLNARLHWSEMPAYFYQNKEKHFQSGAITFQGLHFFEVGFLVMTNRLHELAEHFVYLGSEDTAPTVEAVEQQLRSWLVPVPAGTAKLTAKGKAL